jgi:phospholipase C
VLIIKENHSFDNYFGSFPGVNGAKVPPAQDPPHDHLAWLQRVTHAVKLQYSEKTFQHISRSEDSLPCVTTTSLR